MTSTRRTVRMIQHEDDAGPGLLAVGLEREGIAVEVTRIDRGDPVPTHLAGAVGLAVLGGGMAAYDPTPHLRDELRLIDAAVRAGAPVLGVCLGSQLVAAALGARVYPARAKEIGWHAVTLKPAAAADRLFGPLPGSFVTFHWHGDVFDLPAGAISLASSAATEHQAFRYGDRVYGIQFHPEATAIDVRAMIGASSAELVEEGVSAREMLDEAQSRAARIEALGVPLFQRWAELLT
jgi:GMP synthase (glutamine-hydrolysing)